MLRLVLFDIDGTLIYSNGAGVAAFGRVFAMEFGVQHGAEDIRFAGRTDYSLLREFFREYAIDHTPDNLNRFTSSYVFWLDHLLAEYGGGIFPGVHQWLDDLERMPNPPKLGLLTGNIRLGAEIKLRKFGIWERFTMGAFADDHEERNQIAAVARKRASSLLNRDLAGDEVLVIGDTPLDIACARAIGAKVLAVGTGGHTIDQLKSHQPDWVAEDLTKISVADVFKSV